MVLSGSANAGTAKYLGKGENKAGVKGWRLAVSLNRTA